MSQRSHAFSADEAPTIPARRGALRELAARDAAEAIEARALEEEEAPTTPRRSSTVRARPAARRTPPPLPPTLPRPIRALRPPSPPPPPPRSPVRSLASVLEPRELEPPVVVPSRLALVPPDPDGFHPAPITGGPKTRTSADSTRWLVRIALVLVLLAEELLLAAPAGALHPPRDVSEAGTMVANAIRGSAMAALER